MDEPAHGAVPGAGGGVSPPPDRRAARPADWGHVHPPGGGAARAAIRQELTDHAEYGHWELHRTVVYIDGMQKAWLRRKIIRVPRPPALPSR